MKTVYLDNTATTPLDSRVMDAMRPYFTDEFGNASSIHRFGQVAHAALDTARDVLAHILNVRSAEFFFTGSGTESDNTAIFGALRGRQHTHLITTAVEHHAVLEPCRYLHESGARLTVLPVDGTGMVNPDDCRHAITPETVLIAVMHVNNEVGTIQPIDEIAAIAKEHGIPFHVDAVQSLGKIPVDWSEGGISTAAFSAHKIYGPKGIGGLFVRRGTDIGPLILGGAQERGRRAGTENVPLAVGFAEAAKLLTASLETEQARLSELRVFLLERLASQIPGLIFNGHPDRVLPGIVNVSFDSSVWEIDGESLLFNLDLAGIAVTSGSACTSGSMKPSHVLLAMGRDTNTAKATIRFSMGKSTTKDDLDYTVRELAGVVGRIGRRTG